MKTTEVALFLDGIGYLQIFRDVEADTLSYTPTSLNFKTTNGESIVIGGGFSYIIRTVDK